MEYGSPPAGRGYVRLKHTLAGLALDAISHPRRRRTASALLAYAALSRDGAAVPVEALARTADMPVRAARLALEQTRLFTPADDGRAIVLGVPFRPDAAYFYRQVTRLGEARRLLASPRPRGVAIEIWRAVALFNAGLFFECHEYLEDTWRGAQEPDRTFYHGLIQAAAGCYHVEKGNAHGAGTLLGKAIEKLRPYAPAYLGVDVTGFIAGLRGVLAGVHADPPRLPRSRSDLPAMRVEGAAPPRAGAPH